MKVALITDGIYPYVMGGMQKHSYFLAKYFAKNKVFVDLYHYKDINVGNLPCPFTKEELDYINVFDIVYPKPRHFPGHYLYERYLYSKTILAVFLKQPKVDFIYAKGFAAWALLKNRSKYKIQTPIGVNFHGYEMFQKWPDFKTGIHLQILKQPVLYHMRNADKLFSYGGKISNIIKNKGFEDKIIEIPTGIGSEWITHSENDKNKDIVKFVFVGRAERRKGIQEINLAIKALDQYNFECHFIGPINDTLKIKSNKVIYHGPIYDAEILKKHLDEKDILLCPSYSEGMPNVIMEGMARGLAIIATDVGAVSKLVNTENGWLLDTKDNISKSLMKAMTEAILNPNKISSMKNSSINKVKALQWNHVIKKLITEINCTTKV